ncbi:nitrate ABC transporter ATP-binding protein [Clostridium botulinum]|nr:nitrate ABC transporter ATP-binding protein [Clostridium botulinum]NFE32885.1 nitrate ABC transporter ATP-binding protein [Clostridium botulinum]
MTDIKLFERWVKNALKDQFVFMPCEKFFMVIDGYTGFKIPNKFSSYKKVIKKLTFQDLKSGFSVKKGELREWNNLDILLEYFNISNKTKTTMLPFTYDRSTKMQIFKANDELIFVDKQLLKNINIENYEIYAESPITPLVFESEDITYITLPIRMNGFKYTIEEKQGELRCI